MIWTRSVSLGASFPRAEKEGTINVPASASALIAVGATLNRTTWTDVAGNAIDMPNLGALDNTPLDSIAYFSAAGPNALGAVKPDIVAPGVYLAGAMALRPIRDAPTTKSSPAPGAARPTMSASSSTKRTPSPVARRCPRRSCRARSRCLFERDPTLTQDAARAILQAGARPLEGIVIDPRQIGPGALDLAGALRRGDRRRVARAAHADSAQLAHAVRFVCAPRSELAFDRLRRLA